MAHLYSIDIEGARFEIVADDDQPGTVHHTWVNAPDPGYGYTMRRSNGTLPTRDETEASLRDFLREIDPRTGHLRE